MIKAAFLAIDVQNDFTETGSLPVIGGSAVAAGITAHLRECREWYLVTAATRDWHQPDSTNAGHLAAPGSDPDYATTWPAHCIQGTTGAEYHPALDPALFDFHLVKGMGQPAYSGFQAVTNGAIADEPLEQILREFGITEVTIAGLATDYCVKATALDAIALGYPVTVLTDLVAAVATDTGAAAVADLTAAGVRFVESTPEFPAPPHLMHAAAPMMET